VRSAATVPAGAEDSRLRIDWRIAAACAAVAVVVFAVLAVPLNTATSGFSPLRTLRPQIIMWGLWLLLLPAVFAASRRAHDYGVLTTRGIATHIVVGASLALVHASVWGVIRWYDNPAATRDLGRAVAGMISFLYSGDLLRYFVLAAAYHALAYRREAEQRRVAEAQLTARLAQARLEALEARLHPHFLFNTLNTIGSLIRTNPAAAQAVVENLGELLRTALYAEPGREVTLADELQLLDQYVAIQRARFSDRLRVDVRAPADTLTARVPQLVLQPLVENAIRHGIGPREAPGLVVVEASRNNGTLCLSVRDDGVGFDQANVNGKGIGIVNTRARLAELYGDAFAFAVRPDDRGGTLATIEIPFREEQSAS
jgi:two-component system LytT family sensor kinase